MPPKDQQLDLFEGQPMSNTATIKISATFDRYPVEITIPVATATELPKLLKGIITGLKEAGAQPAFSAPYKGPTYSNSNGQGGGNNGQIIDNVECPKCKQIAPKKLIHSKKTDKDYYLIECGNGHQTWQDAPAAPAPAKDAWDEDPPLPTKEEAAFSWLQEDTDEAA